MPLVEVILNPALEALATKEVLEELSSALTTVVASSLRLAPIEVEFDVNVPKFTRNTTPLRIRVWASASESRLQLKNKMREDLAAALLELGLSKSVYVQNFLNAVRKVGIWVLMPEGSWKSYEITV